MDILRDRLERITELVTLLANYDFEPTVRKISEMTGAGLAQTREDLGQMHRNGIRLFPEDIAQLLRKDESRFDDEVLGLDMELPTDRILLFLDKEEGSLFRNSRFGKMMIKDTPYSVSDAVRRHAEKIKEAVERRCYVRFRYRTPKQKQAVSVHAAPYMLFHNTTDNLYYCITFSDDGMMFAYRLDRILYDVQLIETEHFVPEHEKELERLQYVWGAAFQSDEEPVHIKLKVAAFNRNILSKIKSDVRDRVHGKLRQEGDAWIYEDEVIGLASFRAWVMTYGSAVKVLEPAYLADEIRKSSWQRLKNYEDGGIFHH